MARDPAAPVGKPSHRPFAVGGWQADPAADTLTLEGRIVKLEPRTMRLLVALAERPGEVCATDTLLSEVWAGVVVTGHSLYQAVGELRAALKQDDSTPEFIVNVPRRGYRLVAPVRRETAPRPQTATRMRTIAVLPFRDLGLPEDSKFLREMLLGDLLLELSRQPGLTTIARGTMLAYADAALTPRRVAEELAAGYVVAGAIAHLGDRLSVSCELIDASNDTALASESVDVPAARWPEIGSRVVGRLARALRLELSEHAVRATGQTSPGQAGGALELSTRAWVELYCRAQTRETNQRAWAWASEAVRLDPTIGAAWNVLAYGEWRAAQYAWHDKPRSESLAEAIAHAERAVELAPADPDAHYTLGLATYTHRELERAESALRHCLSISASYAPAHSLLGMVRAVRGYPQETFELCSRAFALSPREPLRAIWHWCLACAASMLGSDEEALDHAGRGIAANAAYPLCHLVAAVSAFRLGRARDASRHVDVLRQGAFSTIEQARLRLPPMEVEPWASSFLGDLHKAGLPER